MTVGEEAVTSMAFFEAASLAQNQARSQPWYPKTTMFFVKMVLISQLDDEPNHCHEKRVFRQTSIHLENHLFPVEMVRASMIPQNPAADPYLFQLRPHRLKRDA